MQFTINFCVEMISKDLKSAWWVHQQLSESVAGYYESWVCNSPEFSCMFRVTWCDTHLYFPYRL